MLKKLVKYGNSNALVLDKALLELLNIAEGSVVKIKTDGTSLIITAQNAGAQENISPTLVPQDTLREAVQENLALTSSNPKAITDFMQGATKRYERYAGVIKKQLEQEPELQKALQELDQRFNGDRLAPKYMKEIAALRKKYGHVFAQLDQEIATLPDKVTGETLFSDEEKKKMASLVPLFKKAHEKYRHVQEQVMRLDENPDYINESVLLAEKYQATKNSPEYIKECTQLITKYIPEYADYQKAIQTVVDSQK